MAQAANFAGSVNQFKSIAQGFKAVTDGNILNRQPDRIRIKTVQRDGSLKDALKDNNQSDKQMDDLAIINGMSLSDKVTKGMLIKTLSK